MDKPILSVKADIIPCWCRADWCTNWSGQRKAGVDSLHGRERARIQAGIPTNPRGTLAVAFVGCRRCVLCACEERLNVVCEGTTTRTAEVKIYPEAH